MPYKLVLLETARKLAEQHDFDGRALREAIPYLEAFQGRKFVLKIGGSILQDERLIPSLVSDVVFLKRLDIDVILVHGGARQLDRRMQAAGLEPSKLDGLRVTSREVLDLANEVFLDISRVIRDAVGPPGIPGRDIRPDQRPGAFQAERRRTRLRGRTGARGCVPAGPTACGNRPHRHRDYFGTGGRRPGVQRQCR